MRADDTAADPVAALEARCRRRGLLLTAPRRAILSAMSTLGAPCDAVTVLLAARRQHAATSMGTVYRLLRELEHHGLADAHAQPHARLRWQLARMGHDDAPVRRQPSTDLPAMRRQIQNFLRDLERLGLAESDSDHTVTQAETKAVDTSRQSAAAIADVLQAIAERFGYRLA